MKRGWSNAVFSGTHCQDKRQRAQTGTQEVTSEHQQALLYFMGDRALEYVAQVSFLSDIQKKHLDVVLGNLVFVSLLEHDFWMR